MHHKNLTFNISGNWVQLRPKAGNSSRYWVLHIEGLTDDTLTLNYLSEESMLSGMRAFAVLFWQLEYLQPKTWSNSKGVMSRGETRLMRLAILLVGISVLTCLVFLLVQLFK